MPEQISLEIAGIRLLFRYFNCQINETESKLNIKDFIQAENIDANDFVVDVEVGSLPKYPRNNVLFQARENWRSYIYEGNYIFETYPNNSDVITRVCIIDKALNKAKAYILPLAEELEIYKKCEASSLKTWSLESFMRVLGQLIFISILHKYQGFLIHASGIIIDGEGIIFSGISGAGKTTLAKLWQNREGIVVLNDDRLIVRKEKEGYFVYGSPWPGEGNVVSSQKASLKKILFLSQAQVNDLIPLEKKSSFHRLLTQGFPALWDKASLGFFLKFCSSLVEDIPCFSFGFTPDNSAVEFILSKLADERGFLAQGWPVIARPV